MVALKPVKFDDNAFYETEDDYNNPELLLGARNLNWPQDAQAFPITNNDLEQFPAWLDEQKLIR